MDGKSPEPAQKDHLHLSVLHWLRTWLQQEGGSEKIPRVIDLLAAQYETALDKGIEPGPVDVETLTELYLIKYGGKLGNATPGRWLRKPNFESWWESHRENIQQSAMNAELQVLPDIRISQSIGRGNSTEYSIVFHNIKDLSAPAQKISLNDHSETREQHNQIVYTIEPAKMIWWLSWLSSSPKYRTKSWRGYVLLALMFVSGAFLLLVWLIGCAAVAKPGPLSLGDILYLIMAVLITWIDWHHFKPILQLPDQRITLIPDVMLNTDQKFGQFRLVREVSALIPQGWLSVVRHTSICPICSGEIDLWKGTADFPGRIVGRCTNAPTEHVYSFDPVQLIGFNLRKV